MGDISKISATCCDWFADTSTLPNKELWDKVAEYCKNDILATEAAFNNHNGDHINYMSYYKPADTYLVRFFDVKRVIFNNPATIVIWKNGDKTVVKCGERDEYDPEKGLAMCFAKHALGDKGSYYNVFKDLLPAKEDQAE